MLEINKIKFAIIGCGKIGKRHAEEIQKVGKLVAVCDIDVVKANELAVKYNALPFYSVESLLNQNLEIDVIAICSPNGLHAEQGIKCLQANKHIVCEKPMALSVEDCEKLIETSSRYNSKIFAVMQNRFNPPIVELKKIVENNILGNILSVHINCFWNRNADYFIDDWRGTKSLDGGTLFTQFSHFVDVLLWLFKNVKFLNAIITNNNHKGIIEFEDCGSINFLINDDTICSFNFTLNAHKTNMEGSITVIGSKGTVKVGGQYLNTIEYQNIENYKIEDLPKGNLPNNYGNYQGSMSNHNKVYDNVVEVLQKNGNISTTAIEGKKTVELISEIYAKANTI